MKSLLVGGPLHGMFADEIKGKYGSRSSDDSRTYTFTILGESWAYRYLGIYDMGSPCYLWATGQSSVGLIDDAIAFAANVPVLLVGGPSHGVCINLTNQLLGRPIPMIDPATNKRFDYWHRGLSIASPRALVYTCQSEMVSEDQIIHAANLANHAQLGQPGFTPTGSNHPRHNRPMS